jgi:hypothetical protein
MTQFQTEPRIYSSETHDFVSQKHMQFAQILSEYDDTLSLEYVPSMDRDETDTKPFRIRQTPRGDQPPYIVRYLTEAEMDNPAEVLAWIWEGDLKKHRPVSILERMEAKEMFDRVLQMKAQDDEREQAIDEMMFLATGGRDKKHTVKHNGKKFERG